jgi:arsenate reductase
MKTSKVQVFGIPNCDSVKKARVWLESNGVDYEFQDFKKNPLTPDRLKFWCSVVDWQVLLNKKSTTWRALSQPEQEAVIDQDSACRVMLANPSLIKRPVIWRQTPTTVWVGVQPEQWAQVLK